MKHLWSLRGSQKWFDSVINTTPVLPSDAHAQPQTPIHGIDDTRDPRPTRQRRAQPVKEYNARWTQPLRNQYRSKDHG